MKKETHAFYHHGKSKKMHKRYGKNLCTLNYTRGELGEKWHCKWGCRGSKVDRMENKCNRKLNSNPGNLREQNSFVSGNTEKTALKVRQQWCKMQKKPDSVNNERH